MNHAPFCAKDAIRREWRGVHASLADHLVGCILTLQMAFWLALRKRG
jgi:hypothetical protein